VTGVQTCALPISDGPLAARTGSPDHQTFRADRVSYSSDAAGRGDVVAEPSKGFWHTVPGIITAIAALITAVGGLLAILIQNDVIGSKDEPPPTTTVGEQTPAATVGGPPRTGATSAGPPSGSLTPWEQANAVLTRTDGTSATVLAATVGIACDTQKVALKNGQSIRLDLVRSIDFDAIYTDNASATGTVNLLDGREVEGPIHTWNCPIMGQNELGQVTIQLDDIDRIDFQR